MQTKPFTTHIPSSNPVVGEFFRHYNECLPLANDILSLTMLQALTDTFISTLITTASLGQQTSSPYGPNQNMFGGPTRGGYPQQMYQSPGSFLSPLEIINPIRAFLALLQQQAGIKQTTQSAPMTRAQAAFNITASPDGDSFEDGTQRFTFWSPDDDIPSLKDKTGIINDEWFTVTDVIDIRQKADQPDATQAILITKPAYEPAE